MVAGIAFEQVVTPEHRETASILIREYLNWLNDHLIRNYGMSFDAEAMVDSDLADANKFHPPHGRFYLVRYEGHVAGVGCLRKLEASVGEVQRMYVRPAFRGKGIGLAVANRLIEDARAIGYRRLRLESLEFLEAAHSLYRSLGFRDIEPYEHNAMEAYQSHRQLEDYYRITVFMEKDL